MVLLHQEYATMMDAILRSMQPKGWT